LHFNKDRDGIAETTSKQVVNLMRFHMSAVKLAAGGDNTLSDTPTAITEEAATNLLDFVIRNISDFQSVSTETADTYSKQSGAQVSLPNSVDALSAWRNTLVALYRAFEMKPMSPLVAALNSLELKMHSFVRDRHITEPTLSTNGFCQMYFNYLLQDFCRVCGDPKTDHSDITALIKRLVINVESVYCRTLRPSS
jgi:hypothetical protein